MAFTKLPRQVAGFSRTHHTELVATLGTYKRDTSIEVIAAGPDVYYQTSGMGFFPGRSCDVPVWQWGAAKPGRSVKLKGRLFAVRRDGLTVTETRENNKDVFVAWR